MPEDPYEKRMKLRYAGVCRVCGADPAARVELLIQAETLQAEDAVNVPLWWGQSATAFADDLGMNDYSSFAFISSWPTQLYRMGQ